MHKRIVDGDGIWQSDKIAQVQPPAFRAEFANLIPLATANGTFEVEPRRIWATVYSFNRPDITPEDTNRILDEFERVKLLFRWTEASTGKRWGYWVGIEKAGRLPAESRRGTHEAIGPEPPKDQLQAFLGHSAETLVEDQLANGNHAEANGQPDGTGLCLGLGVGLASGKGSGSFCLGLGTGGGKPMASHKDQTSEPTAPRTEGFNSTDVAHVLCRQNFWSGRLMIEAVKASIEFKSMEMPECTFEQVGKWLAMSYINHKGEKGERAADPLKYFQQAMYPHSSRKPAGATHLSVNDPAAYARAAMEGD
jgi:hypothetical protein